MTESLAMRPADGEGVGESQIAGFVLDPATTELKGYRWTPQHDTHVDAERTRLRYTVPSLAVPLLDAALRRAVVSGTLIDVSRLTDGACARLGPFRVDAWDGGILSMCPGEGAILSPPPPQLVPETVSIADVFAHWGLDASFDRVEYPVDAVGLPDRLVPDVTLYAVAADDLVVWFGPRNRLGHSCIGFLSGLHPTRSMFTAARALAVRYRYPVVLVYGDPSSPAAADAMECNCGLHVIAVQPETGTTRRAHFAVAGNRVRLCPGERGE